MKLGRAICLCVAALLACGSAEHHMPDYRDDNAKTIVDDATLVLLGNVRRVDALVPEDPNFRPLEVTVDVLRVLKGQYAQSSACFVYFLPSSIGYLVPFIQPVIEGETGVFALIPGGRCFRVVRDHRAIFPVYKLPGDFSKPLEQLVAEATLIVNGCGTVGLYLRYVEAETFKITRALVGTRPTVKLLQDSLDDTDPAVRDCSCVALSRSWSLNDSCLSALPEGLLDSDEIDKIRRDNEEFWESIRRAFNANPVEWLKSSIYLEGLDGTLLRLRGLDAISGFRMPPETCRTFNETFQAGGIDVPLAQSPKLWPDAERIALNQFRTWLDLGCPSDYKPFENPLDVQP